MTPAETEPARPTARLAAKRDLVRDHLLRTIEHADPGTPVASERDLAQELGVSRPTVRAAVDELVDEGHLVRRHGKGTFTAPRKITQQLVGSADHALAVPPAEGTWTGHVIAFEAAAAGPGRALRFGIAAGESVLRLTRVRLVDGGPIALEQMELPAALFPGLAHDDLERGNLYQIMRERYGVTVHDAVQTLEPTVANPDQADLLDIPVYAPLLQIQRTTHDTTGRVVEFTRSVYRGDRYRITSHLNFDHDSG